MTKPTQKVNEYDPEIPQSHTADQPRQPSHKTLGRQLKQPALSSSLMIAKLERTQRNT